MENMNEIFAIIGNVIFGLAVAAVVLTCMYVWKLKKDVEDLTKRVKKLEKGGK